MAQYDELVSLLRHLLTEKFSPKPSFTRGLLGDGNGNVQVPGRPDKSFVRFNRGSTEYFEIFNKTVTPVNDWPVLIGEIPWQPGLTQVVDTDWSAFEQSGWGDNLGNTSPHAPTHEWPDGSPGSDPVNIHLRSIVPGRAYLATTGTTTVFVNSLEYEGTVSGSVWPGTPGVDLSPIIDATTTGTMRYAGIYIDPSLNSLIVVTGSTTVHSSALTPPLVDFPQGVLPAARVKIYGSQSSISEADISDARRLLNPLAEIANFTSPQYVTLATDSNLTNERVLTAGQNVNLTDGGAGSTATIDAVMIVENTSGATAAAGDVGYIDEAGEYKTTTTEADNVTWCVVITGGANNADIYVTRRGRVTVNYTGSDPSAGDYLVTSTTAGDAQQQTTMHPAIFAVCTAAGSGGTVEALLLCNTQFVPYTSSNYIYQIYSHSSSIFTGVINGAPTTTSVVYTVSTGSEDILVPTNSTELSKLMLWNTTRGTHRLITAVNTTTNTITTVSSSDSWADTDVITIADQTISDPLTEKFCGFDLSQQSEIPILARAIAVNTTTNDSNGGGSFRQFHTYTSYNVSKIIGDGGTSSTNTIYNNPIIPLVNRRFGKREYTTGTGTKITFINIVGFFLATS